MKFLICLLITLGVTYGALSTIKPNCINTFCTMDIKICPDGTPAPVPADGCCPSLSACKTVSTPIKPALNCQFMMCPMVFLQCPDGLPAPVPAGGCCPSIFACASSRNLLSNLGQNTNLLSSISHLLPQGTSISTVLSILNLLNNIHQLNTDIHQIPAVLNETLANIFAGAGQAGQVVAQQLLELVGIHSQASSRGLLDGLGQSGNLLSSISHLLPQGTSISTVLSILNLLNNIHQLNTDIHQIPAILNETLANIFAGAGQAGEVVAQQLLNLVGIHSQATSRGLLDTLGQNSNLLSSISHLLPQGTSISTVLSILNLLNNVNAVNQDLHQIPAVLQETIQNILAGIQTVVPSLIQPLEGSS